MPETTLIIGGCRSGKSRHALELAERVPTDQKLFIATCVPSDEEMRQRIARHQTERDPSWTTVEAPLLLPEAILENSRNGRVILVDCLTLWINNLLMQDREPEKITPAVQRLAGVIQAVNSAVILVSNEVGTGIVPENKLARLYRDIAGWTNQQVAASADRVIWMVAGIPVTIKECRHAPQAP
ncbi:MAG: bifunctional adenosylcobinamide kinase/adenosylcobinamide-phosphate guanylyltransferase [Desulfobacterales bacterium]|nr:MAG: bifunctional adenosylcobinamide kinase/adenosylcobinamide-phosphate guanylyltransferase [Desulfobacterales bacterium]